MNLRYNWLPDHHLGVDATVAHADEVIVQAANLLHRFQSQADGIFQLKEVPVVTYSETVVTSIAPIPQKVPSLVAGQGMPIIYPSKTTTNDRICPRTIEGSEPPGSL